MADSLITTTLDPAEAKELKKLKGWFAEDWAHEKAWRLKKQEWERFYEGDQLSDEEKRALNERGQPEVVVNRIKPKIDAIIGIQDQIRVNTRAFQIGQDDFEKEKVVSEVLRFIENRSYFDDEERKAFEDELISGRAWYEIIESFEDEEPDIYIKHQFNTDIILDKHCRLADLSDARRIHKTLWSNVEDAMELFPGNEKFIQSALNDQAKLSDTLSNKLVEHNPDQYQQAGSDSPAGSDELYVDQKTKRIRLTATSFRVPVKREFAYAINLGTKDVTDMSESDRAKLKESFPDVVIYPEFRYKLNCTTWIGNKILERKEDIRSWDKQGKFRLVLVPGYVSKDEKTRMPYGFVKQMIDPQKEINKRRSKMLHLLNVNQVIYEDGAVESETAARMELAKPDGWVKVKPDFRFELVRNVEVAQSQYQLLQEAKREIDEVGLPREAQGQPTNANSGKAIQLRQVQATQGLRGLFGNLRTARRRAFLIALEDAQHYWEAERLIRLTDDPDAQSVILNQKVRDESGKLVGVNNTLLGKYDIIVEEAPETLNLMSEQFDKLVQLATNGIPIDPVDIIEASSLPNKKTILEKFRAQREQLAGGPEGGAPPIPPAL